MSNIDWDIGLEPKVESSMLRNISQYYLEFNRYETVESLKFCDGESNIQWHLRINNMKVLISVC